MKIIPVMLLVCLFSVVESKAQDFPTPQQVRTFALKADSVYSDSLFQQIRRKIVEGLRTDTIVEGYLIIGDKTFYSQHLWAIERMKRRVERGLSQKGWKIKWECENSIAIGTWEDGEPLAIAQWTVRERKVK